VLHDSSKPRRGRSSRSATRDDARGAAGGASKGVKRREAAPKSARGLKAASARPLLVVDGDSFAHRSYHALPKTILRKDGKGGGAIVGFANFLLRLYEAERPRAVLVGWDTLDVPTERHEKFPDYQSGREFDEALIEQLDVLPEFVSACGFANAKAPGYEADDFLAAAAAKEQKRGGTVLVASGDRDTFQLASERTTIVFPVRAGEMARIGPAECRNATASIPTRCPISSRSAAIPPTRSLARAALVRKVQPTCSGGTERWNEFWNQGSFQRRPNRCVFTERLRRWTRRHPCPHSPARSRRGRGRQPLSVTGVSSSWRGDSSSLRSRERHTLAYGEK
jgi:5'-3' exonuclease, N-terminal resolvase-like domain